jgi:hypothetical protein
LVNQAGGLPTMYNDVVYLVSPIAARQGPVILQMARYGDEALQTQYPGDDGTVFKLAKIRDITTTVAGPAASNPESPKLGYPLGNGPPIDIAYRGDDKEAYRWQFEISNNRDRDDYSGVIALAELLALEGQALEDAAPSVIDVDQFMRTLAMASLIQPWDFYTHGVGTKNLNFYVAEGGGLIQALPWDWDSGFEATAAQLPLYGNQGNPHSQLANQELLTKVTERPIFTRLLHGHLLDMIETTFNADYMASWAAEYAAPLGESFAAQLTFIQNRSAYVLSQLPAQIPLSITTNGGAPFSVDEATTTLSGDGWIDVREIRLAGASEALPIQWLDGDSWTTTVPVGFGANSIELEAYDRQGRLVGSNSIVVTSSVTSRPVVDFLRISELHYHPATDGDAEFIEFVNVSSTETLDLTDVAIVNGPSSPFVFPAGTSLSPGEYILVVKSIAKFTAANPGVSPAKIVGEFSGSLNNAGERIRVVDANLATVVDFVYHDGRDPGEEAWHRETDGEGYSLVVVDTSGDYADGANWRSSSAPEGSPGEADPPWQKGDFDGDLVVSRRDLVTLLKSFGQSTGAYRSTGDANHDGAVSLIDLAHVQSQVTSTPAPSPLAASPAAVDSTADSTVRRARRRAIVEANRQAIESTVVRDQAFAEPDDLAPRMMRARRRAWRG